MTDLTRIGTAAKTAHRCLAALDGGQKNALLTAVAGAVRQGCEQIVAANRQDMQRAAAGGMSESMLDRLKLDESRVEAMADAVLQVAGLDDPIGRVEDGRTLENGLKMTRVRVPMGVIGIIYEARPNVTLDAAALCLKTSNCVILKGGKEALDSNRAIVACVRGAIEQMGLDPNMVTLIEDTSREVTTQFMKLNGYLDLLIPRGGAGLIRAVVQNATVPVIETGTGNCHIYVEKSADIDMAVRIAQNAKVSRPSVCNAAESFLVDRQVAAEFLPRVAAAMEDPYVQIVGCKETCAILGKRAEPATEQDYDTEFLDYKVSVKVVSGIEEAMEHIARYSTGHSECIVTRDLKAAEIFTAGVDAAAVYVNASTRFTDGGVFGMGAEIGISTQKLHARGPMGLWEMTSYKYIVMGDGQIR